MAGEPRLLSKRRQGFRNAAELKESGGHQREPSVALCHGAATVTTGGQGACDEGLLSLPHARE